MFPVQNANAVCPRYAQDMSVRLALNIAADPKLTHPKIFENRGKAAKVVFMGMRSKRQSRQFGLARANHR